MKTRLSFNHAFTLIEMLTVMVVIAILASLILSVNAYAQKKAGLTRAEAEMKTMSAACESYKAEAGGYPREIAVSDTLDPRLDGDPTSLKYQNGSLVIYKALSGDADLNGRAKEKGYCEFNPNQLQKDSSGKIKFLKDPFGNSYGYSTAGAALEETYRQKVQQNPAEPRPTGKDLKGFNPTFDLWSTGGVITKATGSPDALDADRKRWVKNW